MNVFMALLKRYITILTTDALNFNIFSFVVLSKFFPHAWETEQKKRFIYFYWKLPLFGMCKFTNIWNVVLVRCVCIVDSI